MPQLHCHASAGFLHLPARHPGPTDAEGLLSHYYYLVTRPDLLVCIHDARRQQGALGQEVAYLDQIASQRLQPCRAGKGDGDGAARCGCGQRFFRLILDLSALHYYLSCQKSVACASAEVEIRVGTVAQEAQIRQAPGIAAGLRYRVREPLQRRPVGPAAGVDCIKARFLNGLLQLSVQVGDDPGIPVLLEVGL